MNVNVYPVAPEVIADNLWDFALASRLAIQAAVTLAPETVPTTPDTHQANPFKPELVLDDNMLPGVHQNPNTLDPQAKNGNGHETSDDEVKETKWNEGSDATSGTGGTLPTRRPGENKIDKATGKEGNGK